ncbi:MAG TPA: hypothetical protein VH277_19560 [Gemmatimonadaceae bacterium]|nr:hypothetical protein [Gemmatimonadaceae bacterium]
MYRSVAAIGRAQRRIFGHNDFLDAERIVEFRLDAVENETRELFTSRYELAVGKLGNIEIDVAVIESVADFNREDSIEQPEIDDHSCFVIDRSADGHVTGVAVPVVVLARAEAKRFFILFVRPVGSAVSVRGGE